MLKTIQWARLLCEICKKFWFFITENQTVWPSRGSWSPPTCSNFLLKRILNPLITLSESILLLVMFSRSSFIRRSFVFLKEVVCSYLSSSISFSLFQSSSFISSSTILSIVLYFGIFSIFFSIITFATFFLYIFLKSILPVHRFYFSVFAGQ